MEESAARGDEWNTRELASSTSSSEHGCCSRRPSGPTPSLSRSTTAVVGLLATVVALVALDTPRVRFINVCLGTWLVVSAFAMRQTSFGTQSNNVIVGVMLTFVALEGPPSTASKRPES